MSGHICADVYRDPRRVCNACEAEGFEAARAASYDAERASMFSVLDDMEAAGYSAVEMRAVLDAWVERSGRRTLDVA